VGRAVTASRLREWLEPHIEGGEGDPAWSGTDGALPSRQRARGG